MVVERLSDGGSDDLDVRTPTVAAVADEARVEHSLLDVRLMDTTEKFNGHSGTPVDTMRTTTQWKLMPWEREEE